MKLLKYLINSRDANNDIRNAMLQTTRDIRGASVNGMAKCAKGRGRPTRTWLRHIAEWTGIGNTTCVKEAESRKKSRKTVKSPKFHNDQQSLRELL